MREYHVVSTTKSPKVMYTPTKKLVDKAFLLFSSCVSSSHSRLSVVVSRRRRRRPSSATRARFVMAGPIHLKLGGCVPWPKRVGRFFHFSILSLYVATRGRY